MTMSTLEQNMKLITGEKQIYQNNFAKKQVKNQIIDT